MIDIILFCLLVFSMYYITKGYVCSEHYEQLYKEVAELKIENINLQIKNNKSMMISEAYANLINEKNNSNNKKETEVNILPINHSLNVEFKKLIDSFNQKGNEGSQDVS